jgi:exodeoxyribonuclease V alpha subunit
MLAHGVPLTATTAHRMLGVTRGGHDGKGWGFQFNEGEPLPQRFIVIDEASMLDTTLAASIVGACGPGTHVLLVGDTGQLPPVGHGAPLRDMIAAGLPHGELMEIQRNAGAIVRVCHAIRRGERFHPCRSIDIPAGENYQHIETPGPSTSRKYIERFFERLPANYSPTMDCQVLVVCNQTGAMARSELNPMLQNVLNSGGEQAKAHPFRCGDKVMCLSNGLLPLAEDDDIEEFVANGEIGIVTYVEPKLALVAFNAPPRVVQVKGDKLKDFDLAYAITTHKSQGSQWPIVLYASDDYRGARFVACRELIYTMLSRAEKLCITVGKMETIYTDCRKQVLNGRKTFLKEMLV